MPLALFFGLFELGGQSSQPTLEVQDIRLKPLPNGEIMPHQPLDIAVNMHIPLVLRRAASRVVGEGLFDVADYPAGLRIDDVLAVPVPHSINEALKAVPPTRFEEERRSLLNLSKPLP